MSDKQSSVRPQQKQLNNSCVCVSCDCGSSGGQPLAVHISQCADVLPVSGVDAGEVDGGDELEAEVEEEVQKVVTLPSYQPTRSEMEEHCVTHTPYRPLPALCGG